VTSAVYFHKNNKPELIIFTYPQNNAPGGCLCQLIDNINPKDPILFIVIQNSYFNKAMSTKAIFVEASRW
jgi:hypothetical protein